MLLFFDELLDEDSVLAGGKGKSLAMLKRAGYPVPNGFVIMPQAFIGGEISPTGWEQVVEAVKRLRGVDPVTLAVRSSGLIEDGSRASFAGQYQTVLNVETLDELRSAIQIVSQSMGKNQPQVYAQALESPGTSRMAVIVQRMVQPVLSGVAFTVDPVTGSYTRMICHMVQGDLEPLVAGEVDGLPFYMDRPDGGYEGPTELEAFSGRLYDMLERLELDLGSPQDVEWAIADGQIYVIQSRPITSLCGSNLATGEWNDTKSGDFLWVHGNLGEAVPGVMTPYTWSLVRQFYEEERKLNPLGRMHPTVGNIFGRLYANASIWASVRAAMGKDPWKALEASTLLYGNIPERIDIPVIPVACWRILYSLTEVAKASQKIWKIAQDLPGFIVKAPTEVQEKRARIQATKNPSDLADYWSVAVEPFLLRASQSILACFYVRDKNVVQAFKEVRQLAGNEAASSLLAGWSTSEEYIESLGPLLGLLKIQQGEMSPSVYSEHYGHRGGDEFEFSKPSPNEDPDWINQRLSEQADEISRLEALLAAQQTRRQTALTRFKADHPEQVELMESRLEQAAQAISLREKTRSEATRVIRLSRDFALQAAELTGLEDDIFFLYIDEVLDLLKGSDYALQFIPARRETDRRYRALPPLPAFIRGRFDAFAWEMDPNRRTDLFDASVSSQVVAPQPVEKETIVGFPASGGVVEGSVRLLTNLNQADQLVSGEVLVARKMDIGWTLLFPKCGGIVTDIGAPLSHAAIVARELGIPAVVGSGDATRFLQTGMRVRVDGLRGTVEILNA